MALKPPLFRLYTVRIVKLLQLIPYRYFYLLGLMVMAVGMPFSNLMMSQGQFIIAGTWLLSGIAFNNIPQKIKAYYTNRQALALAAIYFVLLIGLLYTQNWDYGLKDIRVKLPLFLVPFMLTGLGALTAKEYRLLIIVFIGGLVAASITGFIMYQTGGEALAEPRNLSPFISNIRFSLLIVMAVFLAGWLAISYKNKTITAVVVLTIIWLLYFMLRLESVTGFVLLIAAAVTASLMYNNRMGRALRIAVPAILIGLVIGVWFYIDAEYAEYTHGSKENTTAKTINGNEWNYITDFPFYENGSYIGTTVCRKELQKQWPKYSSINIDSTDAKGQPLYFTILRYLTSKHLTKDSLGLTKLNKHDITNIENGIASVIYIADEGLNSRLHKIFWEYQVYQVYHNPSGHSVFMRLEFWKASIGIIKQHPLTGVGTGDVADAFSMQYNTMNSKLGDKWRMRAHNQFLAIGVALGLFGIIVLLFSILYPYITGNGYKSVMFTTFFITALLSMLTEDTLETQAGVTFYIFFYSLFLFLKPQLAENKKANTI